MEFEDLMQKIYWHTLVFNVIVIWNPLQKNMVFIFLKVFFDCILISLTKTMIFQ